MKEQKGGRKTFFFSHFQWLRKEKKKQKEKTIKSNILSTNKTRKLNSKNANDYRTQNTTQPPQHLTLTTRVGKACIKIYRCAGQTINNNIKLNL